MSGERKFSLQLQIEAQGFACDRQYKLAQGQSIKPSKSRSVEELQLEHMRAVSASLRWLRDNEDALRAWAALPKADRDIIASHGALVAQLARQVADKEAIAKAGGPQR